ncbi:MAG: hypothetical protein ABIP21_02575 [Acidimicrobiia bacterium]
MSEGPLALVERVAAILDDLGIPYALGGSLASSFIGEPRSTVDVDIAIDLDPAAADGLLDRVAAELYVPLTAAQVAIAVTSPEDQVLRKLDWLRQGGGVSEH